MPEHPFIAPNCLDEIQVLFEDEHLLLIDKPSGLLSLSGKHPSNRDSVHHRMVQEYPNVTMVHRLDFGTSGIMLLALRKEVNSNLTKQFQERKIVKQYRSILFGHVADDEGIVDAPIAKAEFPLQKICLQTGKPATTRFHVLQRVRDASSGIKTTHVVFTPLTGRTHQLRIHSLEIGHPIIGCDLYGQKDGPLGDTKHLAKQLALHATHLEFDHPVTKQRIYGKSPEALIQKGLQ